MTHHGFDLVRERTIPEIGAHARLLRHAKTGAELLSVESDDDNKVFGITFRTPPPDSSGVAHIMEHSVLGGSDKYPVKEPFVELAKGSLHTFLNAMTASDKTMYPVASQNLRDLRNLVDVYLDAVLHPRISRHTLLQEGWHYVPDETGESLTYSGVVLNEMKGAYSSPDMLAYRKSLRSVFPDNACGHDSGGDPARIPDLTYEAFRSFHETYYHPSNAFVFWSGDDDPDERLRVLDDAFGDFEPRDVDGAVSLQPRFPEARRERAPFDADEESARCFVTLNWLLGEDLDPESGLVALLMDHALIGTSASPLRKALIDSGLGEDLAGGGLNDSLREAMFSVGLKGVAEDDAGKVEDLVLETLTDLAGNGIDPATVEASLNTIEFRLRENNTGRFPPGLSLMMRVLPAWLGGGDPLGMLAFEAPLGSIRERLAAGERMLEERIRAGFLENAHRTTVVLAPDAGIRRAEEAAERERLDAARAGMSEDDLRQLKEDVAELELIQETPDSEEALATIPSLSLADLDRQGKNVPIEHRRVAGGETLVHEIPTAGIVYLDLGFDLRRLPTDLLPLVPTFGRALVETGTETEDRVRLIQRIGQKTGGLHPTMLVTARSDSPRAEARLFLRGKATVDRAADLLAIVGDVLHGARLDDRERIGSIVRESRARVESMLVPMGNRTARNRLGSGLHEAEWVSEQIGGVDQLFFLRRLADEIESDWPSVEGRLVALREALVERTSLLANVTVDPSASSSVERELAGLVESIPAGDAVAHDRSRGSMPAFEALTLPARANYVAKGADIRALGVEPGGEIEVILNTLHLTYLWDRVRARGGAYGASCGYDRDTGIFAFASYRDPNLLETLRAYDEAGAFLRELRISDEERVRSIIGTIGAIDSPLLPDARGWVSMVRHLTGNTDEMRQRRREQVLGVTAADFRNAAGMLDRVAAEGRVVVVGSPEAVEEARAASGAEIEVTPVH